MLLGMPESNSFSATHPMGDREQVTSVLSLNFLPYEMGQ